jgi:hypothetical protein
VSLPPLATQADADALGYTLPADRADGLLARASARIRRAAGQPITPSDVVWQAKPVCGEITLPAPPIVAVNAVAEVADDGTTTPLTGWRWDGNTLHICDEVEGVQVSYTRGWATIPDGVVELCCEVASRLAEVPTEGEGMVRQRSIDDYSVTYASEQIAAGGDLMPGELAALERELGGVPEAFVVSLR